MRALVIHPAFLGDTVFLGPTLRALKSRWPEIVVAMCVTPRGAPIARLLPGCDQVLIYDKHGADAGWSGLWRAGQALRRFAPDVALIPHRSLRSGALGWLSGAPRRVGYAPLCTERLAIDRALTFVERSLMLAARIGAPGDGGELALRAPAGGGAVEAVLAGLKPPIVGIVPGAEWATKRWSAERFGALASALHAEGATCLVLGGPSERELFQRIQAAAGGPLPRLIDTTGNAIEEAVALLARCDVVVGGDTGLVHCARALRRRTVILFGPTDPAKHRFGSVERALTLGLECQPCHGHGPPRCPLGHHGCMEQLSVEVVLAAARSLLSSAP